MAQSISWKNELRERIPLDLAHDIDLFEGQIELKRQGKIADNIFGETRLRRGAYGQRYDNGLRHDGVATRELNFPSAEITKGSTTKWDAPGMQRIKIPYGGLTTEQLDILGQLAEEYSDGILHVTTRQDIQFHYIHLDDTPDLMRRLGSVGITTQEACGNSVRNVTACPLAGICRTEAFDTTPYADAVTQFLLGHDDVQDFGRKVKIAFSGCAHEACGLVKMHDLGYLGRVKTVNGEPVRGFTLYVGGGLGTVPQQAKVLYEFLTEDEILPVSQAVSRVFARLGEKRNRNRARLKFLIGKLGVDEFRRLVDEEREILPYDPRWTAYIADIGSFAETPKKSPVYLNGAARPDDFEAWFSTNIYQQRQAGYVTVTINLPLGDLSSEQAYALADIARKYTGDTLRTTVEQNIVLRWVSEADLINLYNDLKVVSLATAGAGTIVDITSCPGTDTCKLGIAASRGLAGELRTRLSAKSATLPVAVKDLKIKISGCFNSCGQHHVADIGFFGNSRRRNNRAVPHFQVVLGGQWKENGGSYGLAVGAVPSKIVPDVLDAITNRYVAEREPQEPFQTWVTRLGKVEVRKMLKPFQSVPKYEENAGFYSDWNDPREFSIGDIGIGECAGEVISLFSFEITKAEGEHFDALLALDEGDYLKADAKAYRAMILAARALVRTQFLDVPDETDAVVSEFKTRLFDTKLFFDPFAKGKFGRYLFNRHNNPPTTPTEESAHQLIEEAQLFIEACHAADARIAAMPAAGLLKLA